MLLNNKRFELFFNTYYEPVYLFSLKYVREEPVAQDIAQNVFVRLYEKRENFYAIEKAKSFAYTTAHNLCLNHLRHSQIAQKYISQREEEEEQNCLHEITYQETLRLLSFAISQLPPQTREIIQLGLEGNNNTEIADLLHISVNTVKSMKKSAYRRLREILGKEYRKYYCPFRFLLAITVLIRIGMPTNTTVPTITNPV